MASHPNKHSNGKTIGYKHKSQLKPTGRWDITAAKFMKKLLISLIALFTLTIAANAKQCNASAFCDTYQSISIIYVCDSHVVVDGNVIYYQNNPYANSNTCAPNMNWETCYQYCFTYQGKTYFFNPCC